MAKRCQGSYRIFETDLHRERQLSDGSWAIQCPECARWLKPVSRQTNDGRRTRFPKHVDEVLCS